MSTATDPLKGASRAVSGEVPEVSVVMPCLNEAETLGACIEQIQRTFQEDGIRGEIVVADNGSTDDSDVIAESMGARLVRVARKGYGSALMGGIAAAKAEYIIMGDADMSYDFGHLSRFLEELRAGANLVMGDRFAGGIQPNAMPPLHKYVGNPVLTGIGRLFFGSACRDFHCGLRGFRKSAYERMGLRTTGMEFASEMVVKATVFGMRVTQVPTTLSPDRRSRPPHLRSWRDGWRHLRFLLLYSPRWLFLYPGALVMLLSLALMAWVLPGPRTVGSVEFDVHTLLYAAFGMLLGFQAITFAVFTKIFAITEGLLPRDERLERLFKYVTLETGLAAGAVLMIVGLAGSIIAVGGWAAGNFGHLNPVHTLRLVIPSALALTLGFEVTLTSFFLSVLGLSRR